MSVRKNRGMMLESIINKTISIYRKNGIALFHKKEIPISFSKIKEENGKLRIHDGRIKNKSTTDYYGVYKGKYFSFEAKSTKLNSLPIANIKEHQINYLLDVKKFGGTSFFIICFQKFDEYFIIFPELINNLPNRSLSIQRARENGIKVELIYPGIIDFIELV